MDDPFPTNPTAPSSTEEADPRPPETDLIGWSAWVGSRLAESMAKVLEALETDSRRPRNVGRTLGLNRDIASRLVAMTAGCTPYAALFVSPGPDPLRKALRAAADHAVPEDLIGSASIAVDEFEKLIERGAGTRGRLETTLGAVDPEIRSRIDLASKHAMFTGQAQLRGVQAETIIHAMIITPSLDDTSWLDGLTLEGLVGLQRFRPGVVIHSSSRKVIPPRSLDADGTAIDEVAFDPDAYCVNTPSAYEQEPEGPGFRRVLAEAPLGGAGLRDSIAVNAFRRVLPLKPRQDATPGRAVSGIAAVPTTLMTIDLLLHRDIDPGRDPIVRVYDMRARGEAHIHDASRERDIVDTQDRVDRLGSGPARWDNDGFARHSELLSALLRAEQREPEDFACYRLRVPYPVMNWQYTLIFNADHR
jgi:hypothetical protein